MRLVIAAATDVGQVRSLNEDSFAVADHVVAVADGMGGHLGGEVASAEAVESFVQAATDHPNVDSLLLAVQTANSAVHLRASERHDLTGMGTTLCALAATGPDRCSVVNVGDSRVYLHTNGRLTQISEDHSFVEGLVREGRLTRAQAEVHPQRNVVTRALGIEPYVDVDGWDVVVMNGDRFLLCSDGLTNEVSEPKIADILNGSDSPEAAANELVRRANENGGRDNVTCVVVEVSEVEPADASVAELSVAARLTRHSTAQTVTPTLTGLDPVVVAAPGSTAGRTAGSSAGDAAGASSASRRRPRRFSWRGALFAVAVAAVFAVAVGGVGWYSRYTYSVGVQGDEIVIFQGPKDGVLWIDPIVLRQNLTLDDVTDESIRESLRSGVDQADLAAAQDYVETLRDRITTTTTTTTTTTLPIVTIPPGVPVVPSPGF